LIAAEHESRRPASGEAFSDAVAFAFADPERGLYGIARLGMGGGNASALALLMRGREPVGAIAEGGLPLAADADWEDFAAAGLRASIRSPLESWGLFCDGPEFGWDLVFEAISPPGEVSAVAEGYEQLCRVTGTVRAGSDVVEVDGLGQRGHTWGQADWAGLSLTRGVSMWLGDDVLGGVALAGARPASADGHETESVAAVILEGGEAIAVADPRLSTTYDGDGHTRRVGMELWVTEDGYPLRAAGEVVCGTSLDLGTLQLDVAFLRWHAEGREGVGRYEIVRRAG
jgi:hypothetical protein